jgi:photosystem II stability/assembly factor-like uncharacterized protein
MATTAVAGRLKRMGLLALSIALVLAYFIFSGPVPAASTPDAPQTGAWTHQAPYPTRYGVDGVTFVTPTEAWAVANTDILHTTDGGATWEQQPRPGFNNLYSVDFADTEHGVAMGNTTLYTTNGGDTWTEVQGVFGYDVEMADANLAFITDFRSAGYFRSTNGGAFWTWHTMPSNISTIQCFDSLNCVANSPSGTYHSTNGGLNWTLTSGEPGSYYMSHTHGWYVSQNTARRTTDGGATWQPQTIPGESWIYDVVFADLNNGWAVGDNIIRTTNGGANWVPVPVGPESLPLWDVDALDAQHVIAGGDTSTTSLSTEAVILTSDNGGANWAIRTNGSIQPVRDIVALDTQHAWASHDYGGKISRTTDGGVTWRVTEVGEQYVVLTGIDMANTLTGWAAGYHNTYFDAYIYRTTDGGVSWQRQFDPGMYVIRSVAVLDTQTAIYVGGEQSTGSLERRTTDGGATWHDMNVPIPAFFFDVFFLDNMRGWMVGGNGSQIVRTTDGGNTWTAHNTPSPYTLSAVHFSDANHGWAGGSYGSLVHTTNGGVSWTLQDPQIPEFTHVLAVASTSPTRGWIAGYGGGAESDPYVKYTTDGGNTWIPHTPIVGPYDSFPALSFVSDEYGWAAGWGGIFRHTPTGFQTPTPTATVVATGTAPPATATPGPSSTATPTVNPSVTQVATATPTACAISFTDVDPQHTFYPYVMCLACRGIVVGYPDGTFRPNNPVTRGQLSKIVSGAAGFNEPPGEQVFEDVPVGHIFYEWVNRLASRGIVQGYPCGGAGEPCGPANLPYFRPFANVTRGQSSKIVASAAILPAPPSGQWTFQDVPEGSTFWTWIEALATSGAINGYPCGGTGEPCVPPDNRPYFRPGNDVTRGQSSKIVALTFFPECGP